MCLIFLRKPGQIVTKEMMQRAFTSNSDGWGLTYIAPTSEEVRVKKGIKFEELWSTFNTLQSMDLEVLGHLRMATHGEVDTENTHPFKVHDTAPIYFMHNGIIDYPSNTPKDRSDTWGVAMLVLKPMLSAMNSKQASNFIRSGSFAWIMHEMFGGYNKFAFMDQYGPVLLDNAQWGYTDDGVAISNLYSFGGYSGNNASYSEPMNTGVGYLGLGYYGGYE